MNGTSTVTIMEDRDTDTYGLSEQRPFSLNRLRRFKNHTISISFRYHYFLGDAGNNTFLYDYKYTGIYVKIIDENGLKLQPISNSSYLAIYQCFTRSFIINVTQMSTLTMSFEVEVETIHYENARSDLIYLFVGFMIISTVCTLLLLVPKRPKDFVKAK